MKSKSLIKYPYKFALVGGLFWGLTLFFATLLAAVTGYGSAFLIMVGGIYPGYAISSSGAFIALFFGFMDGFIICYLFAFLSAGRKVKNKK
jgi:hypothetical protein